MNVETDQKSARSEDESILETARARFKKAEEAESEIRKLALEDLEFRAGRQWPEGIRSDRETDGRPCLVINKIPQFVQQITNDQRQNRPAIKVHPVDDRADVETAKVIQGLIRHIEYNSSADVAYDTAFESAVMVGRGFFRVLTDYSDPLSFNQEILIKRIRNQFSVFYDPFSQEPDGSDASWAFVIEDCPKSEYATKYPKSELSSAGADWTSIGNSAPGWVGSEGCRIAEYFYKDTVEKEIVLLSDGRTVLVENLPEGTPETAIVRKRKASIPIVRWCKINGLEILERRDWPGQWIPVVPVYGAEIDVDGERILEGIIRNAKDPARMLNYWVSAETEAIALAPRAPFIGYEGQFEGYEGQWQTANRRNHAYLQVKATTINGSPAPLPQRNSFEPAVQAITQARMLASDDLKATTGIYDAALGAKSNETSGVAIQRRSAQTQTSNYHFVDNLTRSLKHAGRIIVDLIPIIYDTARTARIIGDDGEQRVVKVNEAFEERGKSVLYDVSAGKYDVTIDVGPSFATKRQEAVSSMLEVTKAYPPLAQFAGDLLVKNMDWPGAAEFAERIKKTLPPNLVDDGNGENQAIPPQAKQEMDAMGQLIEQLTGKLNQLQSEKEQKLIEIESKERIEMAKLETQSAVELAKLQSKEAIELLYQQTRELDMRQKRDLGFQVPFPRSEESDPQSFAPQPAGAIGAPMAEGEGANPTGGESPGTPMET